MGGIAQWLWKSWELFLLSVYPTKANDKRVYTARHVLITSPGKRINMEKHMGPWAMYIYDLGGAP